MKHPISQAVNDAECLQYAERLLRNGINKAMMEVSVMLGDELQMLDSDAVVAALWTELNKMLPDAVSDAFYDSKKRLGVLGVDVKGCEAEVRS